MGYGPVEFVVVEFPGGRVDASFAPALRRQVERGVIRIVDLLFVAKDESGTVRSFELSELESDTEYGAFDDVVQAIDGLISPKDVDAIAAELRPGSTAMFVIFEHVWMRELRAAVTATGGRVVYGERIPGPVVDAVVAATEAAEAAESAQAAGAQGPPQAAAAR